MHHWSQIAIRNWRSKPGRTAGATIAIALGVGVVVWVTSSYESVRLAIEQQVWTWIGQSDLTAESMLGYRGTILEVTAEHLAELDDIIVTITSRYVPRLIASREPLGAGATLIGALDAVECDVHGIEPDTEYEFRDYGDMLRSGRLLHHDDQQACMVEDLLAEQLGLGLDDTIYLRLPLDTNNPMYAQDDVSNEPTGFRIVGIFRNRRLARFQPPYVVAQLHDVQALAPLTASDGARVTSIDMKLVDRQMLADRRATGRILRRVRDVVRQHAGMMAVVATAEAKLRQVREAQQQTQLVLILVASVALFTAFFIILSTLSMGLIERIVQLGLLRCVGLTRWQLGLMVLTETIPIGAAGIILGIPVGLGLAAASVWAVPDYLGELAVHGPGLAMAIAGGALTTLAGGLLPALHAMRVSPLDATRPQARASRWVIEWIAAALGGAMVVTHTVMMRELDVPQWLRPETTVISALLIYVGYALMMPLLIRVVSIVAVRLAAVALRIRPKLLNDQIGRATWRSAGICCGLMVGLSLIVCVVVNSESMIAGWDFGSQLAEAFVWDRTDGIPMDSASDLMAAISLNRAFVGEGDGVRELATQPAARVQFLRALGGDENGVADEHAAAARRLRATGRFADLTLDRLERAALIGPKVTGIAGMTLANQIHGTVSNVGGAFNWAVFTEYVVGDADTFFDMARVKFVGCERDEVLARLRRGGYVLITSEYATSRNAEIGDKVRFTVGMGGLVGRGKSTLFEVAGIVDAPALHVAANFFHASGQLTFAASNSIFGTLADAQRLFGDDRIRLFLLDFALPDEPPADDFAQRSPDHLLAEVGSGGLMLGDPAEMHLAERWEWYRQQRVLRDLADAAGMSNAMWGSVQTLKSTLEREIREATLLVTTVPTVALIVAALGVANLMMANVNSRARQIAVLRAVGATKWQIVRLVMAEALVLGIVGSAVGVLLGMHMAQGFQALVFKIYASQPAFTIPWARVLAGMTLTTGICLIAGVLPARYAARSNIAEALQAS